jgi:hypothetical protein
MQIRRILIRVTEIPERTISTRPTPMLTQIFQILNRIMTRRKEEMPTRTITQMRTTSMRTPHMQIRMCLTPIRTLTHLRRIATST